MNDAPFRQVVSAWMASEAYRRLRVGSGMGEGQARDRSLPPQLKIVEGRAEDRYVTCVPLVPLKAAAGAFSEPQHVQDDAFEWVAVRSRHRLRPGMFVAQVVGRSMEPMIPDGSWCLFQSPVAGTRQGRVVLVQHRDIRDLETGGSYTVKRYQSEKESDGSGSWRHTEIQLLPENPEFAPLVLKDVPEDQLRVVAEFVEIIGGKQ